MSGALYIVGALFEFTGIMVVAFPDFLPYGLRFSQWLRAQSRRVVDPIRRLLRRPRSRTVHVADIGVSATVEGRVSAVKSVNHNATLQDQVTFLLTRDQEAQRDVNLLSERLAVIERQMPKQLEELRGRMEEHVSQELAAASNEYLPLRLLGALAFVVGLGCATAGNFV